MNRNIAKNELDFNQLEDITQNLQSVFKRRSDAYRNTVTQISKKLNGFERGAMTRIDVDELKDQIGHLLYYSIKDVKLPIPFDIEFLPPLLSHVKNPTVIVLRRIRKYLMASHRKTLAKLEEEQAQERRLDFKGLDINLTIKKGLQEIQRFQTLAQLAKTVTRKLDILTNALRVPAQTGARFKLIRRIMSDRHHLRYREARSWLEDSAYKGNLKLLVGFMDKGMKLLDDKGDSIFDEMEKLSGIPFDRDTNKLETSFNWYSLGTPLRRGEDFVRIFENEEKVENQLKRLTFFMVRSAWDAAFFKEHMEQCLPNPRELQENCTKLARLYFDLEEKIHESTKADGKVQTAIRSDIEMGTLSEKEAEEAQEWVLQNKAKLQALKLEVFKILADTKADHPEAALPEQLEVLMESPTPDEPSGDRPPIPKLTILDLHRAIEEMEERMTRPNGELLKELCDLRQQIIERRAVSEKVEFQQSLRRACADFEEYESRLLEMNKAETRLDEMRLSCEEWILDCFREIDYEGVDPQILGKAFEVVVDKMLYGIKTLDYSVIDAEQFRDFFDQALSMEEAQALYHLDWLLHEVHIIPRQDQLLNALADWESSLGKAAYEKKQEYILENELELQKLVDEVRAELRERLTLAEVKPRRLRFEVFSLSDCYSGNLKALLEGLLRMATFVASEEEGERLIANIQAIESQIIEAQRITKPKGEAYDKLKEVERLKLFPDDVVQDLYKDLQENFTDLDQLLREANRGLERMRALQNRFGGEHDTAHLSITINIHDLESLKSIYHFVDNITIMDMKRFGIVYKHRYSLMEDLFEKAKNRDPEISPDLAKAITGKVYKQFKQKRFIPLDLKVNIFKEIPDILDFECQLLMRTLNFVTSDQIRNKAVYKGILRMLQEVKSANISRLRVLRRIWTKFQSNLLAFKPRNYKANYQNNTRALITDAKAIIGAKFEDL